MYGSFWSVTKFKDIMAVETSHQVYSSDAKLGGITITDRPMEFRRSSFIAMDPPKHDDQRKVVSPIVAPANLQQHGAASSASASAACWTACRAARPSTGSTAVSIELTTLMLATLFDFPLEERRKLTYWSDVIATAGRQRRRRDRLRGEAQDDLTRVRWRVLHRPVERARERARRGFDLISMLAHGEATRNMSTTRGVPRQPDPADRRRQRHHPQLHHAAALLGAEQEPRRVRQAARQPGLIASMVPEIIRWQTPLAHMRRTALADVELGGKQIRKGDKVVHVVRLGQPRRGR